MLAQALFETFLKCKSACTDTRNIIPGSIFFALKGENFNGNKYAQQAIDAGCIAAVVDEKEFCSSDKCILVDDVLTTMQDLATQYRATFNFPVLGITGSNGKTTSKELIRDVLEKKYSVHATLGNLNNHIGVPLTLLNLKEETDFAIIEMGANHQLEIRDLSKISNPDYGFITNIGKAHLEGFGGPEGVKKGKKELFDHVKAKKGIVFTNTSLPHLSEISEGIEQVRFGSEEDSNYFKIESSDPTLKVIWIRKGVTNISIQSKLAGAYNLGNIAAAVVIGEYFAVPDGDIVSAIESYHPENNRSQWLKTDRNRVIMDAYNANPSSMSEAIKNLKAVGKDSSLAILGDMKEMGEHSAEEHSALVDLLKSLDIPAILIGLDFSKAAKTAQNMISFPSTQDAFDYLKVNQPQGKTILLKGSRSMKLESLKELL